MGLATRLVRDDGRAAVSPGEQAVASGSREVAGAGSTPETGWIGDFVVTSLAWFGIFFAFNLTQPLMPPYLVEMGASPTVIGATMAAFTISAIMFRPPVGLLLDRSGRKLFLLIGLVVFGVATLGYAWASSILVVFLLRVLHGLGWSGCTTAAGTLIADIAPPNRRGEMIGYAGMANNLAAALGPIVGFAAYGLSGYRGMFLASLAVVILTFILALAIRDPRLAPEPSDARRSWIETISVPESLLPAVTLSFLTFCLGGVFSFIPLYALELGMENPALYFTVNATALLLVRPVAGRLSDRLSRRAVILPGYALNIAGMVLLGLAQSSSSLVLLAGVINGVGFGAAHPALMAMAVDKVPPRRRGLSMAQFQVFFDLGLGVGSVALGAVLDQTNNHYPTMFLVSAAVALLGLVVYELQWRKRGGLG